MAHNRSHFDSFDDHTLLKHRILDAYLKTWAFKLLLRPMASDRVFYVDCFAGEGHDGQGNPGSPTIACRIANQVRAKLTADGIAGKGMTVIAIEEKKRRSQRLAAYLAPFADAAPNDVRVMHGEATDHMPEITASIGQRPALYFLDPFGVGGLDASCYPSMLSGPQNEIFALFHDLGALRLRGILHANSELADQIANIRAQPSLFADEHEQIAEVMARIDRRQAQIDRNEPSARRNITRALGNDDWIADLEGMGTEEARVELVFRFIKALLAAGGQNAVLLPMRNAAGTHKYCLVHVSKSNAGSVAMKDAISEGLNEPTLAEEMREAMKNDLRVPIEDVLRQLQEQFGGRTVRWRRDRNEETVQWWLLTQTDVFTFQLSEIKELLLERGWLKRILRKEFCVIPVA